MESSITFLNLVLAVLKWAVGRFKNGTKSLEQNQSMHHDWGIFWHLFGGFSKIKSRNRKNKKYI